jgi:hypothetical protein
MSYAGMASVQNRADLIAYLRSISPNAPARPDPAKLHRGGGSRR